MSILALDISSRSTGYCIMGDSTFIPGSIKMTQKTHGEKLSYFESKIIELILEFNPTDIYIEDIYHGLNIKTYKVLSYYHGIIHKLCYWHCGKDPIIMSPASVRKRIGNKFNIRLNASKQSKALTGLDSKHLTYNFIISHYEITDFNFKDNNDETDAIALALAASLY